jgi:hypothetical protein
MSHLESMPRDRAAQEQLTEDTNSVATLRSAEHDIKKNVVLGVAMADRKVNEIETSVALHF